MKLVDLVLPLLLTIIGTQCYLHFGQTGLLWLMVGYLYLGGTAIMLAASQDLRLRFRRSVLLITSILWPLVLLLAGMALLTGRR